MQLTFGWRHYWCQYRCHCKGYYKCHYRHHCRCHIKRPFDFCWTFIRLLSDFYWTFVKRSSHIHRTFVECPFDLRPTLVPFHPTIVPFRLTTIPFRPTIVLFRPMTISFCPSIILFHPSIIPFHLMFSEGSLHPCKPLPCQSSFKELRRKHGSHISCSRECKRVWGNEPSHSHFGNWSPKWTFESLEGDCRHQNSLDWGVPYNIGKLLKRRWCNPKLPIRLNTSLN
jgi:hypothetical protein